MSRKTLTNRELEITQRIQLFFPRGEIPLEVLNFWTTCDTSILKKYLLIFFKKIPEDITSDIVKVEYIKPNFPHGKGTFLYDNLSSCKLWFHVKEVYSWFHKFSSFDEIINNFEESGLLKNQLNFYELYSIQMKGIEFFKNHFHGTVYAFKGSVVSEGDRYVPGLKEENDSLVLNWYSSWNTFSEPDNFLAFKKKKK